MRYYFFLLLALVCTFTGKGYSLPLQNPSSPTLLVDGIFINSNAPLYFSRFPKFLSFDFGYYGDFVFDRKLKTELGATVHKTEIVTQAGYLALNLCNWLEAFGTLGVTDMHITSSESVLTGNNLLFNSLTKVDTGSNFSWSAGGILKLLEANCWTIGIEGQYFYARPKVKYSMTTFVTEPYMYLSEAKLKYWEAQIGGGISYRLEISPCSALIPYVGIKWCRARLNNINVTVPVTNEALLLLVESHRLGYAVGATLLAYGRGAITGEVRFLDEKAVNVTMKLRF